MWAEIEPAKPSATTRNRPRPAAVKLCASCLRCRAGPNYVWLCGAVEALFDGADADERAGEDAERVERGHYRVHVSPAPCGADRADEQGECGQDR